MSKLDSLFDDVSSMSDDQLLDHIRSIRKDRKLKKPSRKMVNPVTQAKNKEELLSLLKSLPKDQVKELLNGR